MSWQYKDTKVTSLKDLPKGSIGFVYLLQYKSGIRYIGRKYLHSTIKLPILKSGKLRLNYKGYISSYIMPRKKVEVLTVEADWLGYEGSSKEIPKDDILVNKEILHICKDKNCVSYLEEYELFKRGAILKGSKYYNKSIQGRHFDNALEGLL